MWRVGCFIGWGSGTAWVLRLVGIGDDTPLAQPRLSDPQSLDSPPKLGMRLTDPRTVWSTVTVTGWYGEDSQTLQITSDVAVWYRSGLPPVPIR